MTVETLEKGNTLNQSIQDLNDTIECVLNDEKLSKVTSFCDDNEKELFRNACIRYLKTRRSKLEKEFKALK